MLIDDAIRSAESEHEIYSLLDSYLATLEFGVKDANPLTDKQAVELDDVRARFRKLMADLDTTSTSVADKSPEIKQALYIYEAALRRLQSLHHH